MEKMWSRVSIDELCAKIQTQSRETMFAADISCKKKENQ